METVMSNISSNRIIMVVLVLVATYGLARLLGGVMNKAAERYATKRIVIKNIVPLVKILLYIASALYVVFGVLRITADTMIALGVSAGVAVGFAVQDILANVFGGLVILFSRPFNIGDKIRTGNHYGEVTDIGLLRVRIVAGDGSLITIPSKVFSQTAISNSNIGALDCLVVIQIVVPGDLDPAGLRRLAREVVWSSPFAYLKRPVSVTTEDHFSSGLSALRLNIKANVYDHRHESRLTADVTERLKTELRRRNMVPDYFYSGVTRDRSWPSSE